MTKSNRTVDPTKPERQRIPAQARLAAILERLNAGGSVTVTEIAQTFGVSDMTVRRDLSELERDGLLERVHGGAVSLAGGPLTVLDDVEPNFKARSEHNRTAKDQIARAAAHMISRYNTIAMDVGTSAHMTAQYLAPTVRKRVFTNSLRIADTLSNTQIEVYVPGGRVRPDEKSIMGPEAVEQFSKLFFDVSILGISGITADGLFDYSIEDTEMKRVYVAQSQFCIVLCDCSKFRRMSLTKVCDLKEVGMLITDAPPPPDIASALAAAQVEVSIAGPS